MKAFLSLILFLSISFVGFAQQDYSDSGFTNKAEAKNLMVKGKKEGKWVEYFEKYYQITKDTNAPFYRLTIYKSGKPYGMQKMYFKSGKLASEISYVNGKRNGVSREYYENGKLKSVCAFSNDWINGNAINYYENGNISNEDVFTNGVINGIRKCYNEDGSMDFEVLYVNGEREGIQKGYYPDGKLRFLITYKHGREKEEKNYDENGNVIK